MAAFTIHTSRGARSIGDENTCFVVAEMSGNHNQDLSRARAIIDAAAESGADAVKMQTYTPDTITIDSDKDYFQVKTNKAWAGKSLYSLYGSAYTPWEWHSDLMRYAQDKGLIVFSTPFDSSAVDFLETLNVPIYKIASFEVIDHVLLKRVAATKKPVIMSRGMASLEEIAEAYTLLKTSGTPDVALLHCISAYPASVDDMNILTMTDLYQRFTCVVGLSDHSLPHTATLAAVSLGAKIIEKHLTLNRHDGGPDAAFSLEPHEFKEMVGLIRETERALGKTIYGPGAHEQENIKFRKSLFVVKDMKRGEVFTSMNVRSIRPGQGLHPKYFDSILGKKAKKNIERGTPLSWELIE